MLNSEENCVNGLILAAGLSSRMGDFKPLLPFGNKTVIESSIDSMLVAGVKKVVVVLGFCGDRVEEVLRKRYGSELIYAWNYQYTSTDMLESVKCGLKMMPVCQSFFLLPGDMPVIKKSTFLKLLAGRPAERPFLLFPTLEGHRKHPPWIHSFFIPSIIDYHGNGGLRQIWSNYSDYIITVPVDDPGVWIDLDTKHDYGYCISHFQPASEEMP